MSTEQKNNNVEQLLESAKEKGIVSESDLLQLAERSGFDNDQFDHLCELIEGNGIEINYNEVEAEVPLDDLNSGDIEKVLADEGVAFDDPVRMYLKDIGRIPLLNQEREQYLSERIVEGDEKAKNELVEANLRLVVSIAKRYVGKGIFFLDLIQEGNLGLMKAVDKFDCTKGFKFSSSLHKS